MTAKRIGRRQERPLSFSPSAALLTEGAKFNDEIHRLPTGQMTFIPKGIYRYKTHEESNRQQEEWLAQGMAALAAQREMGHE